jgi:hypothetical protein
MNTDVWSGKLVNDLIALESGELNADDVVALFCKLLNGGAVNHLQGSYGRLAHDLIANGAIVTDSRGKYVPADD